MLDCPVKVYQELKLLCHYISQGTLECSRGTEVLSGLRALKGNKDSQLPKGAQGSKGVRGALSRSRGPKMLNGNGCSRKPGVLMGSSGTQGP